jgi:hypothetical protein
LDATPLLRTFNKNIPIMDFTEIRLSGKTRREHDLLGEMEIPAEYYFGVQTMRAVENFHISRVRLNFFPELIRALADVKQGAAMANRDLGLLDPRGLRKGRDSPAVSKTREKALCQNRQRAFFASQLLKSKPTFFFLRQFPPSRQTSQA